MTIARKVIIAVTSFVQLFFAVGTAIAADAVCSLDGKDILYQGQICDQDGKCSHVSDRISIIGDKILLHNSFASSQGVVAYLGRSVELTETDLNSLDLWISPSPNWQTTSRSGRVTASLKDNVVRLDVETVQQLLLLKTRTYTTYSTKTAKAFAISNCNSCAVSDLLLVAKCDGTVCGVWSLQQASCQIEEIPPEILNRQ